MKQGAQLTNLNSKGSVQLRQSGGSKDVCLIGLNRQRFRKIFEKHGPDREGKISFAEFSKFCKNVKIFPDLVTMLELKRLMSFIINPTMSVHSKLSINYHHFEEVLRQLAINSFTSSISESDKIRMFLMHIRNTCKHFYQTNIVFSHGRTESLTEGYFGGMQSGTVSRSITEDNSPANTQRLQVEGEDKSLKSISYQSENNSIDVEIESVLNVLKSPKCPFNDEIQVHSVTPAESTFDTSPALLAEKNGRKPAASRGSATKARQFIQKSQSQKKFDSKREQVKQKRTHFRTMSAGYEPDGPASRRSSPMPKETVITRHSPTPSVAKLMSRSKQRSVGSAQDLMKEINCVPVSFAEQMNFNEPADDSSPFTLARNTNDQSASSNTRPSSDQSQTINNIKAAFSKFKQKAKKWKRPTPVVPPPTFSAEFVMRMIFTSWKGLISFRLRG